jgi:ArsR family transcriptional regulator
MTAEKSGQFIFYSITTTLMEDVLQWILTFKK